jgi:hypothetical protein
MYHVDRLWRRSPPIKRPTITECNVILCAVEDLRVALLLVMSSLLSVVYLELDVWLFMNCVMNCVMNQKL